MMIPLNMQLVARSWAIHCIDAKIPNACLEMPTETKQEAAILSEIPYHCPNTLTQLSPNWTSRRMHFSRDKSCQQEYVIHFYKDGDLTKNKKFLKLYFYENENSAFATILDEKGQVWIDDLCLVWRDKQDENSLWNVSRIWSTPFSTC